MPAIRVIIIKGIQGIEAEVRKILAIINKQKNNLFLLLIKFVEKAVESLLECIVIKTRGSIDGFENTGNSNEELLQVSELRIANQKHSCFIVCAEFLR